VQILQHFVINGLRMSWVGTDMNCRMKITNDGLLCSSVYRPPSLNTSDQILSISKVCKLNFSCARWDFTAGLRYGGL